MHAAGPTLSFDEASRRIKPGRVREDGPFPIPMRAESRACADSLFRDAAGIWIGRCTETGGTLDGKHHLKWVGVGRALQGTRGSEDLKLRTGTVRMGTRPHAGLIILPAVPWW